jgi:hypothetical protein
LSDYKDYLLEKESIDNLIDQGYQIVHVTENLYGAFIDFERKNKKNERQMKQLHIKIAETRKYFSILLINDGES